MKIQGKWLGESFHEFLSNISKEHLLRQLYTFSETYDIQEAFENITKCSHFLFTEDFNRGVEELSLKLGIPLNAVHARKTSVKYSPTEGELEHLRFMLEPEIELYKRLKEYKSSLGNINSLDT
jgi:hypothetical protein